MPDLIGGSAVKRVSSFKVLGVNILNNLFWVQHIDAIAKVCQLTLTILKIFGMTPNIPTNFCCSKYSDYLHYGLVRQSHLIRVHHRYSSSHHQNHLQEALPHEGSLIIKDPTIQAKPLLATNWHSSKFGKSCIPTTVRLLNQPAQL